MLINRTNLDAIRVGFKSSFQAGLGQAPSQYTRVATVVPASTKEQKYGWLGKLPNVREWIGPRALQNLQEHDYAIKEKPWELAISVDRDDIETDNLGIYKPMFEEIGQSAGSHYDLITFSTLKKGFELPCYDGQAYFDTDHPVLDEDGNEVSVANTDGGAGAPWFLMAANRPLKPVILQKRKDFEFVAKDDPKDDNVFMNREFVYGTDARFNTGFGFWQMCWGSAQPLTPANYETGRTALTSMKGDYGRPLGLMPNLLVVGPGNEGAGRDIIKSMLVNGGESNKWAGTAELLVVPWLA
ncbi:Mu-like prophage major head subunit gpT family protein [Kaustia mangrovi]|uniref:Mu-like prophage major head subunit gpT family protein n=1 Tax=Kaustia mangrovi TaxID=2593653 RepID=A0A7S8HDF2_9HYPH|nr:Mu-like prophage major head subunit gpT family protein [Kaustia mangrovi]QPC44626.1 Mu-like prophage major head subunit gpT family protein [Kaustia mangrovi]